MVTSSQVILICFDLCLIPLEDINFRKPLLVIHFIDLFKNKESSRYSNDKDDFAHATWSISFPPTKYNQDETEFIVNKTWIQNNFFDTLESNYMNELRGSDGH